MAESKGGKGTIVVTGANGTLGSAMAAKITASTELASYYGLYTVRSADAAATLKAALGSGKASQQHSHDVLSLDLSSLANVREVAAAINARVAAGEIPPIRALILNAGYLEFLEQTWSVDGFDMSFAVNYLGQWLLAVLLLQSMDRESGKIVVLTSEAHDPYNAKNKASFGSGKWHPFIKDDTTEHIAKGTYSTTKEDPSTQGGYRRYAAAKFCEAMMVGELQRRLNVDEQLHKIRVVGIDPGSTPGKLVRRASWMIRVFMFKFLINILAPISSWINRNGPLRTIDLATTDILAAGLDASPEEAASPEGLYLYGSRLDNITEEAKDPKKRELLWRETVGYTQLKEGETILQQWRNHNGDGAEVPGDGA